MVANVPEAEAGRSPRVSIGLPVFNGENYLEPAIRSILAQTFTDFELIIRDNASTDATATICRAFAAGDPRVHYARNAENLGAAPNYDLCFHAARGTYFKWMAHDDEMEPDFLDKAVKRLDEEPAAVLCCVDVREIGPRGEHLDAFASAFAEVENAGALARFAKAIRMTHTCTDFFGLFRREALVGSQLHGAYRGSDRALLAEMALRGRFVRVAEPLLRNREHAARYSRAAWKDRNEARRWLVASGEGPARFHMWILYRRYFALVDRYVAEPWLRWRCRALLVGWLFREGNAGRLLMDLLWGTSPALVVGGQRIKRALLPRPDRRAPAAEKSASTGGSRRDRAGRVL
jgi:glycosyltransferase involved in cell wall biosynthesis